MKSDISLDEVLIAAGNSVLIANCQCPMWYRNSRWETIWREERRKVMKEIMVDL